MKQKHRGSKLDNLLAEDGLLEECRAEVIKFKLAHEVEQARAARKIGRAEMARKRKVRRAKASR